MSDSLWGDILDNDSELQLVHSVISKASNPKKVKTVEQSIKSKTTDIGVKLNLIESEVNRILGKYKEDTILITTRNDLTSYINEAIKNGIIAIDTETNNSLDPITCKIMGGCIYTPGLKNAYIPINHIDRLTGKRLENQLTEQDLKEEFDRLKDTKIIMHNGKFDYEVIKCTCNCKLDIYWDTLVGAKLLDENERAGLKEQYRTKIDSTQEKYDIEGLFQGLEYSIVPPELFALYAATDSFITFELYKYQVKEFNKEDNKKIFKLFQEVEMPAVEVLAEMEMAGMAVDIEYAKRLSIKFHKRLDEVDNKINAELDKLSSIISDWRKTKGANYHPPKKNGGGDSKSKSEQLTDPINLASPTQLAILFYDILKCESVSKKSPRGTGEEELKLISKKYDLPICNLILERRDCIKLLTTYIDIIPDLSKRWPDGRVRTHFNQYGAKTGRLSSSDPINFQNIPSKEQSVRMIFKAKDGYRIIGGDYSAQEPRITAFLSQDPEMIKAYQEGKDLYSVIAAMSFDREYDDCLEFYPEGTKVIIDGKEIIAGYKDTKNEEGKHYRSMAKSLLLGIEYGRGSASVAEQIKKSKEEAQEIIDKFFSTFPAVKKLVEDSQDNSHTLGYVEDISGRRRRLPEAQLNKYEIIDNNSIQKFNPLLHTSGVCCEPNIAKINKYKDLLRDAKWKSQIDTIIDEASKENIEIHDNSSSIAQAERQSLNSRIQGSAATVTKCALNKIYRDERLKKIGAFLINTVHDEILIEVPEEYAEEASKYLQEDMVTSATDWVTNVPMSTDGYSVTHWYEDEYAVSIKKEYTDLISNNHLSEFEAYQIMEANHTELLSNEIDNALHTDLIFNLD